MQGVADIGHDRTSCQSRRSRAGRALLLATTALGTSLIVAPAQAQNLPTGGSTVAGNATIAVPTPTQMNITQTSQSAVVNWQSFSVGQGYSVNIQQPNSTSALLNRVTGNAPSSIAGSITANGQVYLVNPNGIAITRSGVVNTGGFVASTLGISDSDFMSGKRTFTGAANGAAAGVSNAGSITVGYGGYAALIGGTVENTGNISVPFGKVGLGSGEHVTLDFSGDGFLQVATPTKSGGNDALIRHSGTIQADGGSVIISAATAREAARNAVNISGVVQARTISGRSGSIVIGGGQGGKVNISGRLDATAEHTTGGAITVTGQHIALDGAVIDVTGRNGGGTIRIGGGRQGQGPLQHADTLNVDATTIIRADATTTGNGGDVVLWSDQLTTFAGTIQARGGFQSGNGGEAEVSGKAWLNYTGFTDLTATNGKFGTLLLDPYNVTISTGTNTTTNTGGIFAPTSNDSIINAATLMTALGSANITVTTGSGGGQAGDITVAAPLTWSAPTILTLTAANAVTINAPITITGAGGLAINAVAQTGITTTGLTFGNGASVSYAGGGTIGGQSFSLNGNNYTLVYTMAQLDAIDRRNAVDGTVLTGYGAGLTGNYALANDLAAAGTTYTRAIIGDLPFRSGFPPFGINPADAFGGRLDGLGHIVTDLTINASASAGFLKYQVGLVGMLIDGTVSNIGVVGGSIAGYSNVGTVVGNVSNAAATVQNSYGTATVTSTGGGNSAGGLVGSNNGLVQSSYATGAVTGGYYVGGLVGYSQQDVKRSFATGKVTGTVNTGGLVGFNSGGTVVDSYATGVVSGGDQVGGLAGTNSGGTIQRSYSTGFVSGTTKVGGLIGGNFSAAVVSSYWNSETSGQSNGLGHDDFSQSANVTAQTTAQLQSGSLPSGFGGAWGSGSGLYPYLSWQFVAGTTPQTVSGIAHHADNSVVVGASVTGAINGKVMPYGASTGANGYYYFVVPQGSIAGPGSGVFTAITGNTVKANAFAQGFSASVQDLELYDRQIRIKTSASALSDVASGLATAAGSLSTTDLLFTTPSGVLTPKANTSLILRTSSDFTVDQNLVVWSTLEIFANNALTIAASGSLTSRYDVITLVAGTTFTNNRGADALATPNGRWLIYSNDPANDTRGGLVYAFKQYDATYGVTPVAQPLGNGVLYSLAPGAVAVAVTGVTNSYDGNVNAILAPGNFATTGGIDGDVFTYNFGSAVFSDKNAATGLNVTVTGVTLAGVSDGAATVYGYTLTPPGTLNSVGTITPASITVTAPSGSSLYGTSPANPGYTASGLQNGEGVGVLTGLSNTFGIDSNSGWQGNPYNLAVIGTLTNSNYTVAARIGGVWNVIAPPTDIVASTVSNSMTSSPSSSPTDNSTDPTAMLTNGTSFTATGSGPSTVPGSTVNGGELFYADKRFGE